MPICSILRAWLISIAISGSFPQIATSGIFDHLPSWPVIDVGEPIPDELIQLWSGGGLKGADGQPPIAKWCAGLKGHFDSFPSKGPRKTPVLKNPDDEGEDDGDLHTSCDDGDQTMYNGMLCAVGFNAGCKAVAQAQDDEGRWFRSPHRKWVWTARCKDLLEWETQHTPNKYMLYQKRCAYGFSPDHNLGALLYVLTQHDVRAYRSWLNWLDRNSETTKLCKGDGAPTDDCWEHVIWPRVCTEDIGHGKDPQKLPFLNRYGGECALRPWDTLDFSAVNQALGVASPTRMSNWDVEARTLMRGAKELAAGIAPITRGIEGPPLVFMASFDDAKKFSLHLDAVRVLIRMLIRNPSLQLNGLPNLPDPSNLPGLLDIAASDATDPLSIHIAAKRIADRNQNNPFFRVLADGPTPKVRSLILQRCPAATDTTDSGHWIWEKGANDPTGAKEHSMGWDCAFVGALYNRMRVKKSLADEILDMFLKYGDPIAASTRQASQTLQLAQAANELQENIRKEAERRLRDANDFVNNGYSQMRQETLNGIGNVTEELARLHKQEIELENEVARLANKAAALPDQIAERFVEKICPRALRRACRNVTKIRHVANGAKRGVLGEAESTRAKLTELRKGAMTSARSRLVELNRALANLDVRLQEVRQQLQKGALNQAAEVALKQHELTQRAFAEARRLVAEVQRLDAQLQSRIAIWRNDQPRIDAMTEPASIAAFAPVTQKQGEVENGREAPRELEKLTHKSKYSCADKDNSYFSIVGSFRTAQNAVRHMKNLKAKGIDFAFDVFRTFHRSPHWVVVNRICSTLASAKDRASHARRVGLQRDAYVLWLPHAML